MSVFGLRLVVSESSDFQVGDRMTCVPVRRVQCHAEISRKVFRAIQECRNTILILAQAENPRKTTKVLSAKRRSSRRKRPLTSETSFLGNFLFESVGDSRMPAKQSIINPRRKEDNCSK